MKTTMSVVLQGYFSARSISGSNLRVIANRLSINGLDVHTNGRCRLKHAYVDECTNSDYTNRVVYHFNI